MMGDLGGGSFDFTSVEDMDPSTADGFRVIYDREVPVELRLQVGAYFC